MARLSVRPLVISARLLVRLLVISASASGNIVGDASQTVGETTDKSDGYASNDLLLVLARLLARLLVRLATLARLLVILARLVAREFDC